MNAIALLVFIVVQIVFIPLAVVGILLVLYKQLYGSRKHGLSSTAVEIINGRWTMDIFGIRADAASVKLNRVLPNNSVLGLWLVLFPLYLQYKISGKNRIYPTVAAPGEEGLAHLVINRTLYFDEIIARAKGDVEQFVVMGAGFDTRCYGPLQASGLALFELDKAGTQQAKRSLLQKAAINTAHVRFVEVDFSTQSWYENLEAAGYDPHKKTLFLWEGVTLYFSEQDVRNTLREMQSHSAAGSVAVTDFYARRFVQGETFPGMKISIQALKMTDEELGFGVDFSGDPQKSLNTFIEKEGATVGESHFMGRDTDKGTFMAVIGIKL